MKNYGSYFDDRRIWYTMDIRTQLNPVEDTTKVGLSRSKLVGEFNLRIAQLYN